MATTRLSRKGQIVIPLDIRNDLHLVVGDDFEVQAQGEDTIVLRLVQKRPNQGLVKALLSCPDEFEIPERSKDTYNVMDL